MQPVKLVWSSRLVGQMQNLIVAKLWLGSEERLHG